MDKNSLFVVAILTAALFGAYHYKTNGQGFKNINSIFGPKSSPGEEWKNSDPGWEKLKSDPVPDPTPPVQPPVPPEKEKKSEPPRRKRQPEQQPG